MTAPSATLWLGVVNAASGVNSYVTVTVCRCATVRVQEFAVSLSEIPYKLWFELYSTQQEFAVQYEFAVQLSAGL